jgi:hypothetical protein
LEQEIPNKCRPVQSRNSNKIPKPANCMEQKAKYCMEQDIPKIVSISDLKFYASKLYEMCKVALHGKVWWFN